jgi:acetyl-CoA synthetase
MYASHVLPAARDYGALYCSFRWQIPARYNIGVDVCDRWAEIDPARTAIFNLGADGAVEEVSYGALREASNRLANALAARGIGRGDRIALLLAQGPAVAVSHIAIYKLGAIALPLAMLFGVDAIAYRLADSGARALITNAQGLAKLAAGPDVASGLEFVWSIDGSADGAEDFHAVLARGASDFAPVATTPDDPALMVYTSGTTGPPKGALHAHRVLLGHLPGIEFPHEFLPQPGDRFWTPADWAWAGGLLNVLLPGLHYGVPVVAQKFDKFDPEQAFAVMAKMGVRNAFIPPTALRMLRSVPRPNANVRLRSVGSGGEALGAETYEWGKSALGITINEFYGQTECNLVLASCAAIDVSRPGAIGKPVPGHRVAVIRPDGSRCAAGELGQIAIERPDPVMFLQYWGKPDATREKFIGEWMTTGDQGVTDANGYVAFVGRDDDVITSSGYRIGPTEIEDCLIRHPAVALAAVVGKPDALRTEIVKAFIVLKSGHPPSQALAADIQGFVKTRLSAHEYPREVAFIDEMPMTTTGKVIRRLLRQRA